MSFGVANRSVYSTDASIYQIDPLGVVVPASTSDVAATVTIARAHGAATIPRGGGTSQCGQTLGRAVILDTSKHLNQLISVDKGAMTAWVQPGLVLDELNRDLMKDGLWFPVDVSTSNRATIGGMAGNNSGGARSIRYGMMADNVLSIKGILANGERVSFDRRWRRPGRTAEVLNGERTDQRRSRSLRREIMAIAERERSELRSRIPAVLRHVAGYNLHRLLKPNASLAELLVGSEGTLAYFDQLKLKLARLPSLRVLGVARFPSLFAAMNAVQFVVELDPDAVELMDEPTLSRAKRSKRFRAVASEYVGRDTDAVLLVEFSGEKEETLFRRLADLDKLVASLGPGRSVARATTEAAQKRVWGMRKGALGLVMNMRGDTKPVSVIEDCGIPLPRLREFARSVEEIFERFGATGTWYAHASVGCLHVRPSLDLKRGEGVRALRGIAEEVHSVVRRVGGSYSGEHGDGILRSEFIRPMLGDRITRAFAEVKQVFDPENTFNPGRIVDPPRMDDRSLFRYPPGYGARSRELRTELRWDLPGGIMGAVESCNGNGACRKLSEGAMCPSYRATLNEIDSTRGRANTLRLAMSGQLGPGDLLRPEVSAALDLCVGCKACRRECPLSVDMARMKIETLAKRNALLGVPMRSRLFAEVPAIGRLPGPAKALANRAGASRAVRWIAEKTVGVARGRALPIWSRRSFQDDELPADSDSNGSAVLFADTFHRYFEPEALRAAIRVLGAFGVSPLRPVRGRLGARPLCCGRSYIAAGMLNRARRELRRTVAALGWAARRGISVVGLEPSCILTLRDEAPSLLSSGPQAAEARALAKSSLLLDEFLEAAKPGCSSLKARGSSRQALVHDHCHQKALGASGATMLALGRFTDLDASEIRGSCCGMAGSFGYESEHRAVSMRMGELTLFPAVRSAPEDAVVVANGFSCRAQIRTGAGRAAKHLAVVLAERI